MADELKIQIPKSEWRQGVARSITPELRKMADTFGLDMATAQAAKGEIWLRGESGKIEAAKETLRKIVEEHFPDSDMPEELGGGEAPAPAPAPAAKSPAAKPAKAPKSPEAAKPAPAPAAKKPAAKTPAADKPSALSRLNPFAKKAKAAPAKPAAPAEPSVTPFPVAARSASLPGGELVWLCMVKNSSFMRKCKGTHPKALVMNAEPGNIAGKHSYKYSTIAHAKPLGVAPTLDGIKEKVTVTTPSKFRRPKFAMHATGIPKSAKRGILAIRRFGAIYRRDLLADAKAKYLKVLKTFKKKKSTMRSRRSLK